MVFTSEAAFEEAMVAALLAKGWEEVLVRPTEQQLRDNWAQILFKNNRTIDRLNNVPLSDAEMGQVIDQVVSLRTPLKLNGFINGKTVSIKRDDDSDDQLHRGKEISLKIYDRQEIAGGQSRYQIAQQPVFAARSRMRHDRRGDLMLLINGMPVIHLELKRSGVAVGQAAHQIEKYSKEGLFTGIFSLVQVCVASTPEETVYFANPGPDGTFNPSYFFHWADFNNEPVNSWNEVVSRLLAIPMAHQLIGFYTVADNSDGVLKVMRSYQYEAARAISDRVAKTGWGKKDQLGGFIWHTTGSGKTMTSFKSAQLIASSQDADKVVFLMDRIELGTQSLEEYRSFADDDEEVQATKNTYALIAKLKSDDPGDTLIVTSIQKMSRIDEDEGGLNATDIAVMADKRVVFIVDEAHRSTFGDMLITIKRVFPNAIFFGFTGTPIHEENQRSKNTTVTVFGDELHRYSIADGIRDRNVLGFDPYRVDTYPADQLREQVALAQARASNAEEAVADLAKAKVYYHFMDTEKVPTAGFIAADGSYAKGIEDMLPATQYARHEHRETVVQDICAKWVRYSGGSRFHAIFATDSIAEAIAYFRLFKVVRPELAVTALFDPSIDNNPTAISKEVGLIEILSDYNERYGQDFTLVTHAGFKKDVAARLAHKRPYERVERDPAQQLDILIVVDQMLTGFDSKWVNTLYLDKVLRYEGLIQAFSRTNRLYRDDLKPFGVIRYYRKPATMQRNVDQAFALYSGDRPLGLFVDKLPGNLAKMNQLYADICKLFTDAGVEGFSALPDDYSERGEFAKLFAELSQHLEAAQIQGFDWGAGEQRADFDADTYLVLALRYQELSSTNDREEDEPEQVTFDIKTHLTEIDTGRINADFMNSRFEKYLKALRQGEMSPERVQELLDELHSTFAALSREEQRYADIFIRDVRNGNVSLEDGKTFRDYIVQYQTSAREKRVRRLIDGLGLEAELFLGLLESNVTEQSLNEYGRFDDVKESVDRSVAARHLRAEDGSLLSAWALNRRIHQVLFDFIVHDRLDVEFEVTHADEER